MIEFDNNIHNTYINFKNEIMGAVNEEIQISHNEELNPGFRQKWDNYNENKKIIEELTRRNSFPNEYRPLIDKGFGQYFIDNIPLKEFDVINIMEKDDRDNVIQIAVTSNEYKDHGSSCRLPYISILSVYQNPEVMYIMTLGD